MICYGGAEQPVEAVLALLGDLLVGVNPTAEEHVADRGSSGGASGSVPLTWRFLA